MDPQKYDETIKEFKENAPKKELDPIHLQELEVTDGKSREEQEETLNELRDLEGLFGIKEANHYGTTNRQIFKEALADMNLSEMQSLAIKVGVPASRNRHELKRLLYNSFDGFLKKCDYGIASNQKPVVDPSSPEYKNAVKLLGEGL